MENSALSLVFILLIIVSMETTYQAYLSEYNWFRHRIEDALLLSRDRGPVPSEEVWEMDPEPARVWCLLQAISDVESTEREDIVACGAGERVGDYRCR